MLYLVHIPHFIMLLTFFYKKFTKLSKKFTKFDIKSCFVYHLKRSGSEVNPRRRRASGGFERFMQLVPGWLLNIHVNNMKLSEIYNSKKPVISFEVFPPKILKSEEKDLKFGNLINELRELLKYNPAFISVTYGAGGGTRETTFDLVLKIKEELKIQPMPHFTCVGSTKQDILQYIKKFEDNGIKNILALRGDPPAGQDKFVKTNDGFSFANELAAFIKSQTSLSIGVAGYPECHPDCCSLDIDIQNLKRKIGSGADAVITQLFYDNQSYFKFIEKTTSQGINIPIIPGILPITSYKQLEKIVSLSGCKLPFGFKAKLEDNKEDAEAIKTIGLEFAVNQIRELLSHGAPGIHFYTLNKAFASKMVLDELKIGKENEYTGI